jgi:hypothetical protein
VPGVPHPSLFEGWDARVRENSGCTTCAAEHEKGNRNATKNLSRAGILVN